MNNLCTFAAHSLCHAKCQIDARAISPTQLRKHQDVTSFETSWEMIKYDRLINKPKLNIKMMFSVNPLMPEDPIWEHLLGTIYDVIAPFLLEMGKNVPD